MVIRVLLALIVLMVLFLCLTSLYKGKDRKNTTITEVDKKEYKLYFMFGTGFFILEHMPHRIVNGYIRKLSVKYRQLYVVNDVKEKCILYVTEKICESFLFMLAVLVCTLLYLLKNPSVQEVERIKRPSYDMAEEKHDLIADYDEEESFNIVVAPKQFTKKEALKRFDERKDECIKKMLGNNKSVDESFYN